MRVLFVEDDKIMVDCLHTIVKSTLRKQEIRCEPVFSTNAYEAIAQCDAHLPDLIILDILLSGPDGFTLLNELASYSDTAVIPVIIITSLDLRANNLSQYNIVSTLNKSSMTPENISLAIQQILYRKEVSHA